MPKFRKKPVIIEAVQFTNQTVKEAYEFIYGKVDLRPNTSDGMRWDEYEQILRNDGLRLKTLESDNETQVANIDDWIIKGVQGEFYPIKPDIFAATYEAVD